MEDLKHTLRVNYIGGTNAPKMAKYLSGTMLVVYKGIDGFTLISPVPTCRAWAWIRYMTTEDSALKSA